LGDCFARWKLPRKDKKKGNPPYPPSQRGAKLTPQTSALHTPGAPPTPLY